LPARETLFLTTDEVLAIHERLIETFGGPRGVRDPGLLESALFRPRTGYYGDLAEMAAALFESLLMNHPFVDGNKRVAFFATDVFLRLNGQKLAVRPEAAHRFLIGLLESGECDFARLLPWIRRSIRPLPGRRGEGAGAPKSRRGPRKSAG
jgi:death-on-curing protein